MICPVRVRPSAFAGTLLAGLLAVAAAVAGCSRPAARTPQALRLVDQFDVKLVEGTAKGTASTPRTEWRFDGEAPATPPQAFAATRGWEAGPGVAGLAIKDGLLVGRTTSDFPMLRVERTTGLDNADRLHAIEVRMRASGGANLSVLTRGGATVDFQQEARMAAALPWTITTPILPGDEMQTYTIGVTGAGTSGSIAGTRLRHVLLRPTDEADATFAIESVRLIFSREHLAEVPSGVSWQGLRDVFRETLVTRSPETVRFQVTLPEHPALDLAMGTPEDAAVGFKATVRRDGAEDEVVLMEHILTTPHRWERRILDLDRFAGETVALSLTLSADPPGTIGFWGAPVVRERMPSEARADGASDRPQGVILIQGDTLRIDHLDMFGYERQTAPTLKRLAAEGALFRNAISQTGWTKASTSAVMTSLYPTTHGVHQIPDRLPASATTVAEVFRQAGYATVSFSSVAFTGQATNLHQGFEEVHEVESTIGRSGPRGSKTAREYVDRLVEWLDAHRDVPFFVYLHVFDPHSPYEPFRPYDTMWADASQRDEYPKQLELLSKAIADPFLASRGMATPEEIRKVGLDPEAFLKASKAWYDGSIRGMDTEFNRLIQRLRDFGIDRRTLVAFYADHGEEFHDHGRMWHGHTVYGEMIRVPLLFWWPDGLAPGNEVQEPAQLIDIMPTLLDLTALPHPKGLQGKSLAPLLRRTGDRVGAENPNWPRRMVVAEKQPQGQSTHPSATEAYTIIDGEWKLIRNVVRPPEKPEFELYDFLKDPFDQINVADRHPDVVQRLAKALDGWRSMAAAARLKPDAELTKGMTKEQLERLRSLGYIK